jgi:hypothetical protein
MVVSPMAFDPPSPLVAQVHSEGAFAVSLSVYNKSIEGTL